MEEWIGLNAFIPSTLLPKEGNTKGGFNEKYKHYESIMPHYLEVEKFLDAVLFVRNREIERIQKERESVVKSINILQSKKFNEFNKKHQKELEQLWTKRREMNERLRDLLLEIVQNVTFYRMIKKILQRLRKVKKSIESHASFHKVYQKMIRHIERKLQILYQIPPPPLTVERDEEAKQLVIELNIRTTTLKRLTLVIEEVSPFYKDYIVNDEWEKVRISSLIVKIEALQMHSLLTESDIGQLEKFMNQLKEIPSWANDLDEVRRPRFFSNENSPELSSSFSNPVSQYIAQYELILSGDEDRIFSEVDSSENSLIFSYRRTANGDGDDNHHEIEAFLSNHRNAVPNCRIDITEDGVVFLYALSPIESGERLVSEMSSKVFLLILSQNQEVITPPSPQPQPPQVKKGGGKGDVETKIAELQAKEFLLNNEKNKLELTDIRLRIQFLQKLKNR